MTALPYVFRFTIMLDGRKRHSWIIASNTGEARALLAAARQDYVILSKDWPATLSFWAFPERFPWRDVSYLYRTMARGTADAVLEEALVRSNGFLGHYRTTNAAIRMRGRLREGASVGESMEHAMLHPQQVAVVRAAELRSKTVNALYSLSQEAERRSRAGSKMRELLVQPVIYMLFAIFVFWALTMFILPRTLGSLKQTMQMLGSKARGLSPITTYSMELANFVSAHPIVFSVIVFGSVAAVTVFVLRSKTLDRWSMKLRWVRVIREGSEMAVIWPIFALLREAGAPPHEAADMLGRTSTLPETRQSFAAMYRLLRLGERDDQAAQAANFPFYVTASLAMAVHRGELVTTMSRASDEWLEDVQYASEKLGGVVFVIAMAVAGTLILCTAVMLLFPRFNMMAIMT